MELGGEEEGLKKGSVVVDCRVTVFPFFWVVTFFRGVRPLGPVAVVCRFTLFPFYFQQRAPDPELNYTALLPVYGTIKNRLFRDEIKFIMLPLYVHTRKKDVVTDNFFYPFFT